MLAPAAAIFAPSLTFVGSTGIGSRTETGNVIILPLPQALLRTPVLELPRMLKEAFELQLNLSKRGQLGMQSTILGSESTGEPATSTFALMHALEHGLNIDPRLDLPLNSLLELSQLHS